MSRGTPQKGRPEVKEVVVRKRVRGPRGKRAAGSGQSTLRGLFVGINTYKSPVNRLSCAVADAEALSSLFQDSLAGEFKTLLEDEATGAGIRTELDALETSSEDDFVIITFSGHGTDDHRLVPVDADVRDLASTCISLQEFAERLDRIPAKRLLVILDCCFSGGFGGARVFAPTVARSVTEDRSSVDALVRGSGRVVITASGAGEPALETVEFGHGLLTYYLVSGLQGQDGLGSAGRVPLLDLFRYVMDRVVSAAARIRQVQTPTLYGSVEGAPTMAVLKAGTRYAVAFPDRLRSPATTDWRSLEGYGFNTSLLNAWSLAMPGLNNLQLGAINDYGVLDGRSLLVVAPTGAGKTMVGELAAMRATAEGSRAVILLPLKALVNDKHEYMTRTYGTEVQVVRATGDYSDQVGAILSGQYQVALLTYEKFMNLALGNPHIMLGLSVVVVDEVQTLSDANRGPSLEFLLTLLRSGHGRQASPQIVALSAVIGDTHGLERWLGGALLSSTERPVPLRESVLDATGSARTKEPDGSEIRQAGFVHPQFVSGSQSNKPWVIPLVQRLVREGKKVIVFRSTRGDTVGTAAYLAQSLGLPPASDALQMLPTGDRSATSDDLRRFLGAGVGFHNSDLDRDERIALETSFRDPDSPLRVLVATTTLAMGVNTPAEAVVIAGLTHPGQVSTPYTIAEYKNMVGRAGRPGHTEAGESYVIATADPGPGVAWERYVLGEPEPISSHFLSSSTDPQTLIVRCLVALGASVLEEDLLELLDNSFAIWMRREAGQSGWSPEQLRRDLDDLVSGSLVDREPDGSLTLTALGRYAGESGIEVRSITRIASALRYAPAELGVPDIIALAQVTVELEPLYIPSNRRSRQEQQRWPMTLQQLGTAYTLVNALHVGGTNPFAATKRAVACLLFMSSRPLAEIERILLQHTRDRAAAGNIRQVASRTRDVIDAVFQVAAFNGRTISEGLNTDDLGLRLELGLPAEVLPLAQILGAEINRGEYLSLLGAGVTEGGQVVDLGVEGLTRVIGKAAAEHVARLAATEEDSQ
jgi:ATP-dependent DNA helicase